MKTIRTKAASVSAAEVAAVAAQGVERALEARKAAVEELSSAEAEQVGGAAFSLADRMFIYGYWRDLGLGLGGLPSGNELPGNPAATIGAKTLGV